MRHKFIASGLRRNIYDYTEGYCILHSIMAEVIEIPVELAHFQLPVGVQWRLDYLLDRQDTGETLTALERQEAEGLVELVEYLSLLRFRSQHVIS
jgi:hypothetical protein